MLAPVIDLKRGGSSDERQISDTPPHAVAGLKVCQDSYNRLDITPDFQFMSQPLGKFDNVHLSDS